MLVVIGLFLVTKGKVILSALKLGPLLVTLSSMGAAIAAFSTLWGWKLAAGIVVLILIHELGHAFAAMALGLRVGAPVFIPFFGAYVAIKDQIRSTRANAIIALGGPAAGLLGAAALAAWGTYAETGDRRGFCRAVAWMTAMINGFNLIPFGILDGDKIATALRARHWMPMLMIIGGGLFLIYHQSERIEPTLGILFIAGFARAWSSAGQEKRRREPTRLIDKLEHLDRTERLTDESTVTDADRFIIAASYALLFGLLAYLLLTLAPPI